MSIGLIAKRYAMALHKFSLESRKSECIFREAQWLIAALNSLEELREILSSPLVEKAKKIDMLNHLNKRGFSEVMQRFLRLTVEHEREAILHFILHSYVRLYKELNSIHDVELKSASEMDNSSLEHIRDMLKRRFGGEILLHTSVDRELLGGFILKVDDLLIDSSLRSRLDALKRQYAESNKRIV